MKGYLLDTHVFLWLLSDPKRLSAKAWAICSNSDNQLFISVASAWEMQIKHQLGKLSLPKSPKLLIEEQVQSNGLTVLNLGLGHIDCVSHLPSHHGDPFDRVLMAQSIEENLVLISADQKIQHYAEQVSVLWQ